ncbi:MAG: hypothetical protein ABI169_09320, partial [Chitinophagaceae bacterium]
MKSLLFSLVLLVSLPSIVIAQNAATTDSKKINYPSILSGTEATVISATKVVANPSIAMRDKTMLVDGFDFSWVEKTEKGIEYMGPYHNKGSQMSAECTAAFKLSADKKQVDRIFVDDVDAIDQAGVTVRYKVGV